MHNTLTQLVYSQALVSENSRERHSFHDDLMTRAVKEEGARDIQPGFVKRVTHSSSFLSSRIAHASRPRERDRTSINLKFSALKSHFPSTSPAHDSYSSFKTRGPDRFSRPDSSRARKGLTTHITQTCAGELRRDPLTQTCSSCYHICFPGNPDSS